MKEIPKIHEGEYRFCLILWENEPIQSAQLVTALIKKEEVQLREMNEMVEKTFEGSLPAFIAAFARRQKLSDKDVEELRRLIEQGGDRG